MAQPTRTTPRNKGLSRASIVKAALEIVDHGGLEALNFRRLGPALGATTMAAYSHFSGKEDLLNAMLEHVLGGLEDRLDPADPWDVQVERAMIDLHRAVAEHPGVVDLITLRAEGERLNALRDRLLDVTLAAGFSEVDALDALRALVSYVLGHVLLTRARTPVKVRRGSARAFEYGLSMLMESLRNREP